MVRFLDAVAFASSWAIVWFFLSKGSALAIRSRVLRSVSLVKIERLKISGMGIYSSVEILFQLEYCTTIIGYSSSAWATRSTPKMGAILLQ